MRKMTLLLVMLLYPLALSAEPTAELTRFMEREIDTIETAMSQAQPPAKPSDEKEESWYFKTFMFRLRANAGVDIKGIGKFLVVPELELVWLRELPEGWKTYKP